MKVNINGLEIETEKTNDQLVWEDIFHNENGVVSFSTARAKTFGGWLISHSIRWKDKLTTSMCFMPDENHEWKVE
jgi:hypothetical protein